MDYYVDTTPHFTNFVKWANVAPYEPDRRQTQNSLTLSETPTFVSGATDFFGAIDGPAAPTPHPTRRPAGVVYGKLTGSSLSAPAAQQKVNMSAGSNDGELIAKQRVRLMAAKYATGDESSELVARLEILNRRLSERLPRVSVQQVQALEAASSQLTDAKRIREERMRRLAIGA